MGETEGDLADRTSTKGAMLIKFNDLKKITYFGKCEFEFDGLHKYLVVKTEDFPQLNISIDQIFFQKENFLCVIDEATKNNFVVVFPDKMKCKNVMNEIKNYEPCQSNDFTTEDNLFKQNFYIPILKEIQAGIEKFEELRNIILALVNSFQADLRRDYMDLIFEESFNNSKNFSSSMDNSRIGSVTNITLNESSTNTDFGNNGSGVSYNPLFPDSMLNETHQSPYNFRERPDKSIKREIMENEENFGINSFTYKRKRFSSINDLSNFTDVAHHKFIGFIQNGDLTFRLLIFTSKQEIHCYEFLYHRRNDNYYCKMCKYQGVIMSVKIHVNDDETVKFRFGKNQHICQPIEYSPNNYKSNGSLSLNYSLPETECRRSNRNSFLVNNESAENVSDNSNITDQINFIVPKNEPIDYDMDDELQPLNYKIVEDKKTRMKRLIIFTSKDGKLCYVFNYHRSKKCYYCKTCCNQYKRFVSIQEAANRNGKKKFEYGKHHHICEPTEYSSIDYEVTISCGDKLNVLDNDNNDDESNGVLDQTSDAVNSQTNDTSLFREEENATFASIKSELNSSSADILFTTSSYEIVEFLRNRFRTKRLLLFTSAEKTQCYEFYYNSTRNSYYCKRCSQSKRCVSIKIITESEGNLELKSNGKQHICRPILYSPDNYKDEPAVKIVHKPNYLINELKSKDRSMKKELLIFNPTNANEVFTYTYSNAHKYFYCLKCLKLHKHVQARLKEDEKAQEFIELSNAEHICNQSPITS